ncbi:radial spoke head protein 4 homolog a-like [Plakobranchus ocellatus]|uniref:Radial spoke head protein 4 homolog a-like n=1 Tax=Plakobranchus ocellatus TaxID=259542 RepID=A0AAV4BI54_9GAST|nr:radial spoke head protein 4 homolog a-like [Plakobranchus ocellatus]
MLARRRENEGAEDEDGDKDEDDEDDEEKKEPDKSISGNTAAFVPEHSPVAVISVTWPGEVAVAIDKASFTQLFDPATPEAPQMEFPIGPEVTEKDDPTPGEEAAIMTELREQGEWKLLRGKGRGENDEDDEENDDDDERDKGDAEDIEDYDENDDDYSSAFNLVVFLYFLSFNIPNRF